jgi:hypothetical protein
MTRPAKFPSQKCTIRNFFKPATVQEPATKLPKVTAVATRAMATRAIATHAIATHAIATLQAHISSPPIQDAGLASITLNQAQRDRRFTGVNEIPDTDEEVNEEADEDADEDVGKDIDNTNQDSTAPALSSVPCPRDCGKMFANYRQAISHRCSYPTKTNIPYM